MNNSNSNGNLSTMIKRSDSNYGFYDSPTTTTTMNEYIPLCFSKDVFNSNTFEVDQFISDCRKRVNLESVQKDLREYSKYLDSQLIELINKEYKSFFSLSSSLIGIDNVLNDFNKTQSSIKSEVMTFKKEINKVRECVEDKLKEKKSIDQRKKLLQLYISISESLNNMNHLLDQFNLLPSSNSNISNNSNSNQQQQQQPSSFESLELAIDRVSNSFYQMQNQMSSLSKEERSLKMFDTLGNKIKSLSHTIQSKIDPLFKDCLKGLYSNQDGGGGGKDHKTKINSIIHQCLSCYQIIDKMQSPYSIFKHLIVKTNITKITTLTNLELNQKSSTNGLANIYDSIFTFIKKDCIPFIKLSNSVKTVVIQLDINDDNNNNNNITTYKAFYNFLSESILPEIEESLMIPFKQIFATGIPDLFYKNYYLTFNFISLLENECVSHQQLTQFRNSTSYQNLWKKWNFPVYFQLRLSDIASKLEFDYLNQSLFDQIVVPVVPPNTSSTSNQSTTATSTLFLNSSNGLINCLNLCWDKNIYIYDLSAKFFKLFLQLVSRYDYFIQESIQPLELNLEQEQQQQQSQQNQSQQDLLKSPPATAALLLRQQQQQQQPQQQPHHQTNKHNTPDNLVYVYSDILQLRDKLLNHYKSKIISTISSTPNNTNSSNSNSNNNNQLPHSNQIKDIINNGINETVKEMELLLPRLTNIFCSFLISKCSENLELINTIRSTYRMTNKPIPTKPSVYVSSIVGPLESFLSSKSYTIETETKHQWIIKILTPVTEGFKTNASNVLQSVSASNDILNKIVKRNKPTTTAAQESSVSDIDKISIQLYLDVDRYSILIQKLGISISQIPSFNDLYQLVAPFKSLIPTPTAASISSTTPSSTNQ